MTRPSNRDPLSDTTAALAGESRPGPRPAPDQKPGMYVQFLVDHPFLVRTGIYSGVIGSIGAGLFMWLTGRLEFKDAGYTGIFVINLVSSASVIVPVPGVAAVCGSSVPALHLNPLTLGVVGATGASLGEITGYLAGFGGQPMAARYRLYARIHDWAVRRGGVGLLLLALIPNPFFDIAGIAAGGVGYPLHKFLLYVFAGKTIRFTGIAYACRLGIDWFTRFT